MPFAPQIQNRVLQALEHHILPALRNKEILQVFGTPPFELSPVEYQEVEQKYLRHQTPDPLQVAWQWKKERMSASRFCHMIFVYEGTVDHKIGITTRIAKKVKVETGQTLSGALIVRLPSPCVFYSPPGYPGQSSPDATSIAADSKSLRLSVMSQDIRFHLSGSESSKPFVSHSLQIHDPLLVQMALLYEEELQATAPRNKDVAQAQLYVMMSRLYRQLQNQRASLGNSAWSTPLISSSINTPNKREQALCQQAMDYIETRLNSELSRTGIAQTLRVSPDHLGRVFYLTTGVTLMRYVTQRRIQAAKLILELEGENITEIAKLVGFTNPTSFSAAFKRATGYVPRDYRRQHRISHNT